MFSDAPLPLATLHFNTESKLTNACLQFSLQLLREQIIGIDVLVRHKEIFPNCQMIKFQCKRANNHGHMDSIHQGKFVVYE